MYYRLIKQNKVLRNIYTSIIKNKLYQKGFEQVLIDEYVSKKVSENPDLELDILKKFIIRKKLSKLETDELKKALSTKLLWQFNI